MDRWSNIDNFLQWAKAVQHQAIKDLNNFSENDYYDEEAFANKYSKYNYALRNAGIDIESIKIVINDRILNHINMYFPDTDIEPYHIETFLMAVESIDFFKRSNFSNDAKEYHREIKQLKKRADNLQLFSATPITIRLPRLPQDTLYLMISSLRTSGLNETLIRYFYDFFSDRKRIPRWTKSMQAEYREFESAIKHQHNLSDRLISLKNSLSWYSPLSKDK